MHTMDFSRVAFGERMRMYLEEVMHRGGGARTEARKVDAPAVIDA